MASTASPPPPHSPASPAFQPYQALSDSDHCIPPSTVSAELPLSRARSGSRTYSEVQEDERRERERSREREKAAASLEGRVSGEVHRAEQQQGEGMSVSELRAEMETLLSLRRRSTTRPGGVDPDLPPTAPPTSAPSPSATKRPQLALTVTPPTESPMGGPISPTAPTPAETGTLVRRKSSVSGRLPSEHPLPIPPVPSPPAIHSPSSFATADADIPHSAAGQDLFWLPASLHPELAPQEFKAFIREQTRPEALARRSSLSVGAAGGRGVGRRASLLRGEYKPRKDDGVGETPEKPAAPSIKRTTSERQSNRRSTLNFEELTIRDLQRLEELAAKAEAEGGAGDAEGEGERLGRVLRRSLSLNPHRVAAAAAAAGATFPGAPTAAGSDTLASVSEDDEEAPLIVPPPGQIVRRNARTRIRKDLGAGAAIAAGRAPGSSRFGSRRTKSTTSDSGVQLTPGGVDDDALSTGDISYESMESEEIASSKSMQARSAEDLQQQQYQSSSPPSSDSHHGVGVQHFEIVGDIPSPPLAAPVPQVVLDLAQDETFVASPDTTVALGAPNVASPIEQAPPPPPSQQPQHAISPASADYDYATHSLPYEQQMQQQQQQQAPAPPPPEPQYTVHPGHSPRQPFSDVPPPQAVPLPLPGPERRKEPPPIPSPPPPRLESPKPASVKEKKSGWARLGLGGKDEEKKKKGKGKEKAPANHEKQESTEERENERTHTSTLSSSGFFGGLFGRKRADSSSSTAESPQAPSPPAAVEARMPPPPPTASGALLPNGRYANFYRLPIHVERAVYRLSHIKLANPRRPLYEQVLISNLMFWYLGLIQKPVQQTPAAPPVPIPGMRTQQTPQSSNGSPSSASPSSQQQREKRPGLHKPGRGSGGRSAEQPVRGTSFEMQNQQLAEEQQQHHYRQQQQQLSQSHPQPSSSSSAPSTSSSPGVSFAKSLFAAPLSSSSNSASNDAKQRPPDRSSAPAHMYSDHAEPRTPPNSTEDGEDDRPLATYPQREQQSFRESYPQHRPVAVSNRPTQEPGFQVTSRSPRLSGGGGTFEAQPGAYLLPSSASATSPPQPQHQQQGHSRNLSAVSDKSFDAGEIYDAYNGGPASPGSSPPVELAPPPSPPPPSPAKEKEKETEKEKERVAPPVPTPQGGKPPLLGTVAPRGSSLKALVGVGGKKDKLGLRSR
ncbi:hypothetical protein JCM11641_005322 [Rhodosporidiobolus odoratus]